MVGQLDGAHMKSERWHADKVAVVTGGNAGIGKAIALELAQRGARVAVGARRCSDALIAGQIEADLGPSAIALGLDVQDVTSIEAFRNDVVERLGTPSILVNAAGISVHQPVCGHAEADWMSVIDTNLNGPFRMTRALMPDMIAAGWGRIVNIASTAARVAEPTHPAYCASKAGLVGLTKATAREGAPHGVIALTVSPTWVETEMLRSSAAIQAKKAGHDAATEIEILAQANPQNRLVQAGEIAALVSFLCSDAAPGLTMEDVQVNAGAHW